MSKDMLLRGVLFNRAARFTLISARDMVEAARATHKLSRVCTAALGRALQMTAIMGVSLKGEDEKVTTIVKGGGMAGNIVCTANHAGAVKGYIENPTLELPPTPGGKLDVALAVGWFGELMVTRDHSMREPYVGRCEMVSGELGEDFANYYTRSEQTPSLVYLGVRLDAVSGDVLSAGGALIQALPGCPEEVIAALESKAEEISALALRLERGESLSAIAASIFAGCQMETLESLVPQYICDCSRERLERVLLSLGKDELLDMIEKDGGAQLTCRFCQSIYSFDEDQLKALIKEGGG